MPVTSPVNVPQEPQYKKVDIEYEVREGKAESPFTGQRQTTNHQGEFWKGELVLPEMNKKEMAPWKSFVMKLRGGKHYFKIAEPHFKTPRGSANGNPEVAGPGNAPFVKLDGDGDSINVPDDSAFDISSAVTIEAWVTINEVISGQALVSKVEDNSKDEDFELGLNDQNVAFIIGDGSQNELVGNETIEKGIPHHVAGTFDGSDMKVYVDGQLDNSKSLSSSITNGAADLEFGATPSGNEYFNGDLSDIRLWKTARTETELQNNLVDRLTGNETDLVGYWRLKDGSGTTVTDETGNDNTGTLKGDANFENTEESLIVTRGWNGNQTNVLREGDNFEVQDHLKSTIKDHDTDSLGIAKLEFRPRARETYSGGSAITTDTPKGKFELDESRVGWSNVQPKLFEGLTIPIREVF